MSIQRCKPVTLACLFAFSLNLIGCSGMSDTERRVGTGAGIGAASGAVVGSMTGSWAWGAVGGAAVGAGGGYLYDKHKKNEEKEQDAAYQKGQQAGQSQQSQ